VQQTEDDGDDLATWQWKPKKLVSAPFSRLRSRRVHRHPIAAAARIAAQVALVAARTAAACAAASATRAALKYGFIGTRHVIPNAIKWGPQVAGRAWVNQATRTIRRVARRGAGRAGTTSGMVMGTAGQMSWQALTRVADVARQQWGQTSTAWRSSVGSLFRGRSTRRMDILQPAPGASKMGHLLRAVKITGFMIKWGAHLSTLAAGVWMLHGMVVIKIQANKEQRLLDNHLVKCAGSKDYQDDSRIMDIYSFPGYQVEIEVPANPDGSSRPVILDKTLCVETDPVILGKNGVSVYEIPAEKEKLPADDWVDLEDS
jgi:hypothetical protein